MEREGLVSQSAQLSKNAQWSMQQRKIIFRPEKSKGWKVEHGTQLGLLRWQKGISLKSCQEMPSGQYNEEN